MVQEIWHISGSFIASNSPDFAAEGMANVSLYQPPGGTTWMTWLSPYSTASR